MTGSFITHSEAETESLGERFAKGLSRGDIVALTGELGAGKTAFTRGIARGLGCVGAVTSPTFTIMNIYDGELPLAHFDVYRIGQDELFNTGYFDFAGGDCVTVVEWSDIIDSYIEDGAIDVVVEYIGEGSRRITISKRGGSEC